MPTLLSSAIDRVEYDSSTHSLQVWFRSSGGPYTYFGVPEPVYVGLLAASSAGRYFDAYIRGAYSFK